MYFSGCAGADDMIASGRAFAVYEIAPETDWIDGVWNAITQR